MLTKILIVIRRPKEKEMVKVVVMKILKICNLMKRWKVLPKEFRKTGELRKLGERIKYLTEF
eukprot:NODE_11887_length_293_cov_10.028689_g10974_i0.p2 GENE.NODE_11887_length_293_cov_10.028689_g10974_i0~~NODE_11887_length_293_cov_10.028689_g10974_i0.p2  ORF type:complete len:62 (-),score=0.37 NODE_11887_length_293_cov_10.028689_g10974_i0:48-233(-)